MRLIDLSQPITHDGPNCPAHPPVRCEVVIDHDRGDWHLEVITLASHTGSHVDAPLHKIKGGTSIDAFPLETWVGPAYLADLRGLPEDHGITAEELAGALRTDQLADHIVLIATGFGDQRAKSYAWLKHSAYLAPDAAQWLVDRNARAVGIDHWSIGGCIEEPNVQTHTTLLGNGLWVVEDLRFPDEVFALPQPVKFWSLPINFPGFSGMFCRPVIEVEG